MNDIKYVKATDLNRGKASAYIKEVHDSNCDVMILKNSEPYAVIISIDKYEKFQESIQRLEGMEKISDEIRTEKNK